MKRGLNAIKEKLYKRHVKLLICYSIGFVLGISTWLCAKNFYGNNWAYVKNAWIVLLSCVALVVLSFQSVYYLINTHRKFELDSYKYPLDVIDAEMKAPITRILDEGCIYLTENYIVFIYLKEVKIIERNKVVGYTEQNSESNNVINRILILKMNNGTLIPITRVSTKGSDIADRLYYAVKQEIIDYIQSANTPQPPAYSAYDFYGA